MATKVSDAFARKWLNQYYDYDIDAFLDFAERININEFCIENGERVIWLEDGNTYTAHAQRLGENDGIAQSEIINLLAGAGVEF